MKDNEKEDLIIALNTIATLTKTDPEKLKSLTLIKTTEEFIKHGDNDLSRKALILIIDEIQKLIRGYTDYTNVDGVKNIELIHLVCKNTIISLGGGEIK